MSAFPLPAATPLPSPAAVGPTLAKVRAEATAEREMRAFPARWLTALPLPPRLGLHVPGVEGVVRVALGSSAAGDTAPTGEVTFSSAEWVALCRGVEADRIWPTDLAEICHRKATNPAYRLEMEDALGGVQVDENERWALDRVLERVDAHLVVF